MKRLAFVFPWLVFACASPTARIQPKVDEFKRLFPDRIQVYQGVIRKMQFAWSGNPHNPPLIFVHGSPGSWEGWAEFLLNDELQKNFHVLAVNRPGYGESGAGISELSLRKQAEEVMSVLRFNHSGARAILVGHSYGGAVIAQIAADMPSKVAALVFVSSSVDPALEQKKWIQVPASWWPIRVLIPGALRVCNEEIMALKGELELLEPRWKEMSVAVATVQGGDDDLVPPANQDYILARVPGDRVRYKARVPGMNHFVPWQHPELILAAIAAVR